MWKLSEKINYNMLAAQRWMNQKRPDEIHNAGGDCFNPSCDYEYTPQDEQNIRDMSGWHTCPNPECDTTYNALDNRSVTYQPGGATRVPGISMDTMGSIGENLIQKLGVIPNVGSVQQVFTEKNHPIDAVIGPYGVEIKTNHSEAQPRFKIGGERIYDAETKAWLPPRKAKDLFCQRNGLVPAIIGVRLNFYYGEADIFFRQGFSDTWIGNPKLQHVSTVDFSEFNPYKRPEDVPPANELPDDDTTPHLQKSAWYANLDNPAAYSGSEEYWGFRWGWYNGDLKYEDQEYLNNTHPEMAMQWGLVDEDSWDDIDNAEVYFGYGVYDIENDHLVLNPYSIDYGDFQLPQGVISSIVDRLSLEGFMPEDVSVEVNASI